jgi:hydroxymethylbilane synthase
VQARAINPQIEVVELRGNLDTRLRKSTEPEYDGIIVAAAGLDRMGWQEQITEYLPIDRFVPAPGQGAIGVECRADDAELRTILARVDHDATRIAVTAERAVLAAAGAGCTMPLAAYAEQHDETLQLWGMAADVDDANPRWIVRTAPASDPGRAGWQLAEALGLVSGVRA